MRWIYGSLQLWSCSVLLVFVAFLILAIPSRAGTVIIDSDTVIDANNSFPDDHVDIVDGSSGSPQVSLLDDGLIGLSVDVLDGSELTIDGGTVGTFANVRDDARVNVINGSIECTSLACENIDFLGTLRAFGNGQMHVFGGDFGGSIEAVENSEVHIYGTSLRITSNLPNGGGGRTIEIEGMLVNRSLAQPLGIVIFDQAQLVLHNIPEPPSVLTITLGTMLVTCCMPTHRLKSFISA